MTKEERIKEVRDRKRNPINDQSMSLTFVAI